MLAKYGCTMFAAILQKHLLGHSFLTKVHYRVMILVSGTGVKGQGIRFHHSFCGSVCLAVLPSACPVLPYFVHLFYLSIHPPSYSLSVFLSIHLSSCLFIHLFFHLSRYLSIHQFVLPWFHKSPCLSGLYRGLLLTVTGDCSCLVFSAFLSQFCWMRIKCPSGFRKECI